MRRKKLPLFISIPHGGSLVPSELMNSVTLSRRDIFLDGDAETEKIFNFKNRVANVIEMQYARAIIDVNRPPFDLPPSNEDGAVKTVRVNGRPVYIGGRYPDSTVIKKLIKKYHFNFHKKISRRLDISIHKAAFDCHSMLPADPKTGKPRPLICISNNGNPNGLSTRLRAATCPAHWMKELRSLFMQVFAGEGEIKINEPFFGGYITRHHYAARGIPWIQIEINRRLYLDSPYFDQKTLKVSETRLIELRERIYWVLEKFCGRIFR
ncbi:MAG TPA: N-formylglutamate amidohydrolase [Firmicutes bacterium]|nr:N-formylglutamate amidohydrolase [Bacillota bacterium]